MTNQQFIEYLVGKLEAAKKAKNSDQEKMLTSALNLMTHGAGPARRRFRRDYERNLARRGKTLEG